MHRHADSPEAFFVLEGEYLMFFDDHREVCPSGGFVYVPCGVPYTFQVVSESPGKKLNVFTTAAMVGFLEDLAAEADGTATSELLESIASRNHMEDLGSVLESYL